MLTGDRIEGSSFFKQGIHNQLISEDWTFLYVFFLEIITSNTDPFIAQITADCFMSFGNCFLTYATR